VDHTAILDIGAGANPDMAHIAADHAIIPDARVLAECDIAKDAATRSNEGRRCDPRGETFYGQ